MDWEKFCDNIKEILELEKYKKFLYWKIDQKEILIKYIFTDDKYVEFKYTKKQFSGDCKNISKDESLEITNDCYYEIPVSALNEHLPIGYQLDRQLIGNEYKDEENNLKYVIDNPSEQFWLKIIELKIRPRAMMFLRRMLLLEREYKFKRGVEKKNIFDLLRIVYRDFITLKIFSINSYKKVYFQKLADAFMFNINYNTDIGIRQRYEFEDIRERMRNSRFRNESIFEVSVPKRIYKKELTEQYNMASTSEDPFIKYLCYYHILEHFYELVYKEEIIRIVKEQLTLPNFSIKKEKELIKLIDAIKEKVKSDREDFDGNELEALELVIKKYVDMNKIKTKIEDIDLELVTYYDRQKVEFSQGIPINFNDTDNLCKNIAKRVYFTRNALVHYKSNDLNQKEKGIYRPFNDRTELLKEVPLIRILAEEVIVNDSEII